MSGKDKKPIPPLSFLPTTRDEMKRLGWSELDFLCVVGDAYVDHPSFGHAIVSRLLESLGYRVGVIAQPDWRGVDDFARMGRPRLAVLVAAGNLDSMLSNYSSPGKKRAQDVYSPGGRPGRRPDRATIVYCNRIRELWKDVPLIIGGIEASLRRVAHYDYWEDGVRRSILVDSRADLLIYGMAERQLAAIAQVLADMGNEGSRRCAPGIRGVPGTCWKTHDKGDAPGALDLPAFDEVRRDKASFAEAFRIFYMEQNFAEGRRIIQDNGSWFVVCNPPPPPLSTEELDRIYALPYTRRPHPSYAGEEVPALSEVRFSLTSHRGCFGECAFCAISSHQGRVIQPRSVRGITKEAEVLVSMPEFKGYIHDVGGPTANFRAPACKKSTKSGPCRGRSCLFPEPCESLQIDHTGYLELLRAVRAVPGVKKAFVRSGLRYDYIMADPSGMEFLEELCLYHISGQMKIAPEHSDPAVLMRMRKAPGRVTESFIKAYREINNRIGKKQFLVPYFMSSHPGCGLRESLSLALFIRDMGVRPRQAQEFTPVPGTVSACMYHSGIDPFTGDAVYSPRGAEEKKMQRALLQYWMPENRSLVVKALKKLNAVGAIR
jgi:uncharacterized radical SAM protein YgiQ